MPHRTQVLLKAIAAVLTMLVMGLLLEHHAGAVTYYGPEDTRVRYVLEHSTTTTATSLSVPIYYKANPGTVTVYAGDFLRNTGGGTNVRVSFNGGPQVSSDTSFALGGFTYDPSSGWYKATVTATMQNYSGTSWRNYIHFRLELGNRSGYIGYGGGSFQQASKGYYATSPASNYSLYMATPCTVTSNQVRTLTLYDLDNRNADNGGYHISVNVYDETTGQHIANRDGDRDGGMGQGGTLNINITFQPRHKYRVDIINVSPNNVIQYNFPFDNIAYTIGCQWSVSGTSTVNRTTATVGDVINWTHQLRNDGPHVLDRSVYSNIGMSGITGRSGWATGVNGATIGAGTGVGRIRNITSSVGNYTRLTVTQDDVNRSLCEWIQWDPTNSSGGRNGRSSQACVSIPYNYTLNPSVEVLQNEVDVGGRLDIQAKVDNSGPTKSKPTQWQLSYITIPSNGSIPSAINNSAAPCSYYGGGGRTCQVGTFTSGGSGTGTGTIITPPTRDFTPRVSAAEDLEVGTKVCYALSVRDRSSSSSQWRHSAPDCAVVSKRPVVQVLGGDLIVGRGISGGLITTSVKNAGGKSYGSWAEYGIVASGKVTGMGSAAGYAGGVNTTALCGVSYLTFSNRVGSNACNANAIGQYTYKTAASTIASRFPTASATAISGNKSVKNDLSSGVTYTSNAANSEIRLTASPGDRVEAGKWVVINAPNATVKIMNNIMYTDDSLTSVAQLPQVVIIAKNIIIADSVTQIDAWLVAVGTGADGIINTCGAGGVNETTTLTSKVCGNRLTVNGPVSARHLLLRRTAGAGAGSDRQTGSGAPAEVFNLRPDAYMWASNLQANTSKARTVLTTELPPRY